MRRAPSSNIALWPRTFAFGATGSVTTVDPISNTVHAEEHPWEHPCGYRNTAADYYVIARMLREILYHSQSFSKQIVDDGAYTLSIDAVRNPGRRTSQSALNDETES